MNRLIENEMEKPTIKEVKEYFKDAAIVKCLADKKNFAYNQDTTTELETIYIHEESNAVLWSPYMGYAEIVCYKKPCISEMLDIIKEKPKQYSKGIDTFSRAEQNMSLSERMACVKWNIDKYNWRDKGQDIEDLKKIIAYAEYGIKQLTKN